MELITKRYRIIKESIGMPMFLASLFISIFLGKIDFLSRKCVEYDFCPSSMGEDMIFGFPSWILGITAAFFFMFIWCLEYAVRLEDKLRDQEENSKLTTDHINAIKEQTQAIKMQHYHPKTGRYIDPRKR